MPGWLEKWLADFLVKTFGTGELTKVLEVLKLMLGEVVKHWPAAQAFEMRAVCWVAAQVKNSSNKVDDAIFQFVAAQLGVDPSKCQVP